ncbi:MAG: transposase [Acidimicrobiales bacterium]
MAVIIGIDPHTGSHTAAALDETEGVLGELRVRSSATQLEHLLAWAVRWPERTWAIEGAGGLGYLLAQQLIAAGERVVDVQPKGGQGALISHLVPKSLLTTKRPRYGAVGPSRRAGDRCDVLSVVRPALHFEDQASACSLRLSTRRGEH